MNYQSIRFEISGPVATITLARPGKLNALTPDMADEIRHALAHTEEARSVAEHRLPIVAEVTGAAAGIGCSIALACDFCVAGQSAYFLQAFVNIGLVPDGGASWILPRLIGKARAAEMLMLGEKVHGKRAA
ncbi:enoyl-CoA hydratase-related protein, partial [Sphingomonas sp.]|uniref:enoyl-CoA hydratase-related protein n=1 Tax=Sphingomonas sp. TaxID=28214 RepID=UPI0035A89226